MNPENQNFGLITIGSIAEERYNFLIADYQRPYKWTFQQVLDLLNDIDDFLPNKNEFYCLQPLVVKLSEDKKGYNVIDGQQRLTTVYLILKFCNQDEQLYNLTFNTRNVSSDFLKEADKLLADLIVCDIDVNEHIIHEAWKIFLTKNENSKYNKIDIFHFFGAYFTIKSWFEIKKVDKVEFAKKLKENTQFIWYNAQEGIETKVFRDLNSGKIPLTNAELIKALFIIAIGDEGKLGKIRKGNFAREWNAVEQGLQDDCFWYFINNVTDESRYATRIDYLFELIVGQKVDEKKKEDNLFTYRYYSECSSLLSEWKKVKGVFYKLQEWYEDREYYHLIGFLVCTGFWKIKNILDLDLMSKSEFKKLLKSKIKTKLSAENKEGIHIYSLNGLNYKDSREASIKVLLLFNVISAQRVNAGYRFPFNEYKVRKWSLEHIHAQNDRNLSDEGNLDSWKKETTNFIQTWDREERQKQVSEQQKRLIKELKEIKFTKQVGEVVKEFENSLSDSLNLHGIGNLALLEGSFNSSLGNKSFAGKREAILINEKKYHIEKNTKKEVATEIKTTDKVASAVVINETEGKSKSFIPIATRNVFFKYYSPNAENFQSWGLSDRKNYTQSIAELLIEYLP